MDEELLSCLAKTIKDEYVSVLHDYNTEETNYLIPYNATHASLSVKLKLVQLLELDWDANFDASDPYDIERAAWHLAVADQTPLFSLGFSHYIDENGTLMTHFILDFEEEVLFAESYPTDQLSPKNTLVSLMRLCSKKIVKQEKMARKYNMQKMFISTNAFLVNAQKCK